MYKPTNSVTCTHYLKCFTCVNSFNSLSESIHSSHMRKQRHRKFEGIAEVTELMFQSYNLNLGLVPAEAKPLTTLLYS